MKRSITPNEPANFTPTLGEYKDLGPFRMWCQKVLPLVYDDSVSYYEVLCKLVNYLNVMLENVNTLDGDVTGLHEAYKQLEAYVNNYFDSLDVQEEINQKLDAMVKNGELQQILLPLISGYVAPKVVETQDEMTDTNKLYILKNSGNLWQWNGNVFADTGIRYIGSLSNYVEFVGRLGDEAEINNIPINTIYIITSSNTSVNNPFKGLSSFIYTFGEQVATSQKAIQFETNRIAWRTKSGSIWSDWKMVNNVEFKNRVAENQNFNNLPLNSVCIAPPSDSYLNAPFNTASFVFTYGEVGAVTQKAYQFETNKEAWRIQSGSAWTDWKMTDNLSFKGRLKGGSNVFNIEPNTIYLLSPGEFLNNPFSGLATYIITIGESENKIQYAIQYETGRMAYSVNKGNWKNLFKFYDKEPLYIAFGDSIIEGAIYSKSSPPVKTIAKVEYQIPTRIAQALNLSNFKNLGVGGMAYTNTLNADMKMIDYIKTQNINNAMLITISAGRNDVDYSIDDIMKEITDIIEYVQYNATMAQICIIQPTPASGVQGEEFSKMTAGGWSLDTFSERMKDVVDKYNVCYVDWKNVSLIHNWALITSSGDNHVHPTSETMYYALGNAIAGKISKFYSN